MAADSVVLKSRGLEHVPDVVAVLVGFGDPGHRPAVLVGVGLELPRQRLAHAPDVRLRERLHPHARQLQEQALHQVLGPLGRAAEVDRQGVGRRRDLVAGGGHLHAVGPRLVLAQHGAELPLENQAQHAEQRPLGGVPPEGAGEDHAHPALRLDPLLDELLDDAARRPDAGVFPALLPSGGRQRGEVAGDEGPDGGGIEAAREHEHEVAGVGEPVLVERVRLLEVHLRDDLGRQRPLPEVVLPDDGRHGVFEDGVGIGAAIRGQRLRLVHHDAERGGVGPGLREPEVHQLQQRLEIASRPSAGQPFERLLEERQHGGHLPGQHLVEGDGIEAGQAPRRDDLGGGGGRHVVRIGHQRGAARADGADIHLVLLERGRMQHDAGAV